MLCFVMGIASMQYFFVLCYLTRIVSPVSVFPISRTQNPPQGLLCCISFMVSSSLTTSKPKLSNSTCIKQHSNCAWSAVTEVCGFEALQPVVGIGLHVPKLKMVFAWVLYLLYIGIVWSGMYWILLNCSYLTLMVESVLVWSCIPHLFSIHVFYFILNHLMGKQSKSDVEQMIQYFPESNSSIVYSCWGHFVKRP